MCSARSQNPEKFIPMVIKKVRDNQLVTIHANPEKTIAGSEHLYMQRM